jgi:hypothetical protein
MESDTPILARCAGCDRNFETRHYGRQACPICHAEVFVPQQPGGTSDGFTPPPEEAAPGPLPDQSSKISIETHPQAPALENQLEREVEPRLQEFIPAFESGTQGYVRGFIQTIKEIISSPAAFFIRVRVGKTGIWSAIVFGAIICTIALNFSILYILLLLHRNHQAFLSALQGKLIGISPEDYLTVINTVLSWAMYLSPLLGLANVFLCAALYHVVVIITATNNRGFGATVRATAYGFTPLLLLAIPYIGQFLGGMWTLALQVIALSQIHRMSPWRAALVVLLPTVALMLLLAMPMLIKGPA